MNVLQLHERTEIKGGAEVYISQLQELLPLDGHISYWLGINEYDKGYSITEYKNGILFHSHSLNETLFFVKNFVRDNSIDLINIHNIFNRALINLCLDLAPVVKSCHSPVMVCPGKDKFWRYSERVCNVKYGLHCFWHIYSEGCANRHPKRVFKAWNIVQYEVDNASKRYRKIVVMSEFIKNGLLECGIPANKIVCNPYFTSKVDNDREFQSGSGLKHLFFAGRLVSSKGPHIMLEALSELLRQRSDVHLDIVGDGNMKNELQNIIDGLNLQSKVTLHGWLDRDSTATLLEKSYLVIFPSVYPEAFGIVGIEAMMRGKPVIGFNVGGVGTWLKDGLTGFLVDGHDVAALRDRTNLLLDDESLYVEIGTNAREFTMSSFTPEIHMKMLMDIYRSSIEVS